MLGKVYPRTGYENPEGQ